MNTNNTPRTLDCNLPPCPPGKTYGFTAADVHNTLLTYIRSHGFPCRFQDGKIRAASHIQRPASTACVFGAGCFCHDRPMKWQIDTIEPTLSAIRTWLGY